MKVKIFLTIALFLLFASLISATDTNVVVKTIPGYKAYIRFTDPSSPTAYLNSFTYTANTKGEIKFVFSTTKDDFNVKIWLSKDGVAIINKEYEDDFNAGEDLTLEIYPAWYVPPQPAANATNQTNATTASINETTNSTLNQTETNQTNTTLAPETVESGEEKAEKDKKFTTALSIEDGKVSISTKVFYYILGAIVIAGILFFSIREIKRAKKNRPEKGIKVTRLSEVNKPKPAESIQEQQARIAAAKRKIEEAEAELQKMRNEDKIAEVKKRLIEDEKELLRLRSGR